MHPLKAPSFLSRINSLLNLYFLFVCFVLFCFVLFFFLCRWKIGEDGLIVQKQDKNVLEFVAVKSPQSLKWAMPGVRCIYESFFLNIFHFTEKDSYNYTVQLLSN